MPECSFFLFGMGDREKLLYKDGVLARALTGEPLHKWDVKSERIQPPEYAVTLVTTQDETVTITEDETGVWLSQARKRTALARSRLNLPRFRRYARPALLRVLHHEVLINVVDGKPVPNLWVYPKPWYRDAAMVCLCLEKTGNLRVVRDWVLGLREPFDRNNAGHREPDNLGQALYMISLVSDASHPLVDTVLDAIPEFRRGNHIADSTDFAEHPVYQTKWLKFGLRALELDDPYEIPRVKDSYSALFWMDYANEHVPMSPFGQAAGDNYPYLVWAEAHFHGWPPPTDLDEHQYPLTWEARASQADYPKMGLLSEEYVQQRLCVPHSWHAAEMFLYFLDQG